MKFRTELQLPPSDWRINHQSPLLFLGSCFANEIGTRFTENKFPATVNPGGIIFHPLPLMALLKATMLPREEFLSQIQTDQFQREGQWGTFALPGTHSSQKELSDHLEALHHTLSQALKNSKYLVLTFGTAIGFNHQTLDKIVANCHKFPGDHFQRQTTTLKILTDTVTATLKKAMAFNPGLRILVTVSPIRHIRSGMVANSASKSILRTLCFELESTLEAVRYFPSFEIMMDDLRDYRFYKSDLIHPNQMALDYIWEKVAGVFFSNDTQEDILNLEKVQRDLAHRPQNPQAPAHHKFIKQLESKIESLEPILDMSLEREILKRLKQEAGD